jgi:hypothetical protein
MIIPHPVVFKPKDLRFGNVCLNGNDTWSVITCGHSQRVCNCFWEFQSPSLRGEVPVKPLKERGLLHVG